MKKPPDVIYIDKKPKPNIDNFLNLLNWAVINNDGYLYERAFKKIKELTRAQN